MMATEPGTVKNKLSKFSNARTVGRGRDFIISIFGIFGIFIIFDNNIRKQASYQEEKYTYKIQC
jgi:hypothetical protein